MKGCSQNLGEKAILFLTPEEPKLNNTNIYTECMTKDPNFFDYQNKQDPFGSSSFNQLFSIRMKNKRRQREGSTLVDSTWQESFDPAKLGHRMSTSTYFSNNFAKESKKKNKNLVGCSLQDSVLSSGTRMSLESLSNKHGADKIKVAPRLGSIGQNRAPLGSRTLFEVEEGVDSSLSESMVLSSKFEHSKHFFIRYDS